MEIVELLGIAPVYHPPLATPKKIINKEDIKVKYFSFLLPILLQCYLSLLFQKFGNELCCGWSQLGIGTIQNRIQLRTQEFFQGVPVHT